MRAIFKDVLQQYHQQTVCEARKHADALHLSDTALDATLLTLMVRAVRGGSRPCFGDGVVAAKNRAGELEVTVVSYLGGYPFYPNYLADADRHNALFQQKDNLRQIETFRIDAQEGDVDVTVRKRVRSGYRLPVCSGQNRGLCMGGRIFRWRSLLYQRGEADERVASTSLFRWPRLAGTAGVQDERRSVRAAPDAEVSAAMRRARLAAP